MIQEKNIRTVITGIGPISSVGIGKDNFWRGLCQKKINIEKVEHVLDAKIFATFYKHKVWNFNIKDFGIEAYMLESIEEWKEGEKDLDLLYLLAAAKLAIEDSDLEYDVESNNIGLIVTHENPGLSQYFTKILDMSFNYVSKKQGENSRTDFYNYMLAKMMKSSYELQTFMPLFHIARVLGLHGYSLFINNACASGAFAFEEAKKIISSGLCDVVILVGGDLSDVYKYLWFDQLKMYSVGGISRPFCKNSDGFILGDGATGIVVERLEYARERNAQIYGEYLGGGFALESWKVTLPNPGRGFYSKVINDALTITATKMDEIDLIIPHGVGTSMNDKYEISSFQKVLKDCYSKVAIAALKPYFGHNLGGNVLLEVAALMMMFKQNYILPTLNVAGDKLDPRLNLTTHLIAKEIRCAMKTTAAFAGFDSSIIFKRVK